MFKINRMRNVCNFQNGLQNCLEKLQISLNYNIKLPKICLETPLANSNNSRTPPKKKNSGPAHDFYTQSIFKSIHLYITLWGKKIRNINLHIHSSSLINVMVRTKY